MSSPRNPALEGSPQTDGTVDVALLSSLRAARRDAERRSLLRKSAAARARELTPCGRHQAELTPAMEAPEHEASGAPPPPCPSWRSTAARQAYLPTLPPPAADSTQVRVSHKA